MSPAETHQNDTTDVDVAIVGGKSLSDISGPTGLFNGLLLHRLGVSVSILDAKKETLDFGRADALNARTQQYLEVAGLLDELLPQGLECNTSSTFAKGEFKSRQNDWWVSLEHTLHKNFLMLGQPVIEAMLCKRLPGLVHFGETVTEISEGKTQVEVITSTGRRVRAKYVIGADGARSTVRNALGISFTGTKPEMLWAVIDAFIETDFPTCPEIITFQINGQSRVSWIPRERGLSRFYVLLEGEVTEERAKESVKLHLAPYKVEFTKVEWYSTFDVKERLASSFISNGGDGRVILAGDAAHVHSVNGGQGLNTGLADAFGLSWRLAMVLKQDNLKTGAADKLLRSYDLERRTTAKGVIDVAAALVRDTVHTAKQYVSTIQRNAGYITGMGVSYQDMNSPLVVESTHSFWTAGKRCPDVEVTDAPHGKTHRLYSAVEYGKYALLFVGKHPEGRVGYEKVASCYSILPRSSDDTAPVPQGSGEAGEQTLSREAGEKVFEADWVTQEDSFVVVVRPDMYIGYVGTDEQGWKSYLDELFSQE
ncbi:unnamed protein product [Clonostachys solani]|uniref:FAD-binding domain-containing protein n=1 Tax=Clonostachys solani TaxID=160281 RepID=A0A9N9VZU8_9HYPO|nr:unnamed protein product [Clonostachys solani]